jgi:hypothetical protein
MDVVSDLVSATSASDADADTPAEVSDDADDE